MILGIAFDLQQSYGSALAQHLVRCAVLVQKVPPALSQLCHKIIIGIAYLVARATVADFKVFGMLRSWIEELMRVTAASPKAGSHAWRQWSLTRVGTQNQTARQQVDELILRPVGMT